MKTEALAGPQVYNDGSRNVIRQGRLGASIITKLHGKYAEQTARGNVYCAISAAGTMQPPGSSAVPMCLQNPIGSNKYLYLLRTYLLPITTNATTVVTGMFAYYGVSNALFNNVIGVATINPTLIGAAASFNSVAICPTSGSVTVNPNPFLLMPFATKFGTAVISQTTGLPQRIVDDVDGQIVIPPGCMLFLQQTVTDGADITAIVSFVWEEVPI